MSWQVIAAMTGAMNRSHNLRWVSACLADHGRSAGCRAGDRYQVIRSAPGRSRFGASAVSRSVTLSSLAASRSSVAASHCRRVAVLVPDRPPPAPRYPGRVHRHPAPQLHHHTVYGLTGRVRSSHDVSLRPRAARTFPVMRRGGVAPREAFGFVAR